MKKILKITALLISVFMVMSLCGCGEKPIPKYNTPVEGRTVDKTDATSVIENALMVDIADKLGVCEATGVAFHEYAKEQSGKIAKYYLVASVGGYAYENGKLTRSYGMSPFAVRIILKDNKGNFDVVGYDAAVGFEEVEERDAFIKEIFPEGTDVSKLFEGRAKTLFEAEKQQIIKNHGFSESEFATGDELVELLPVTNEAYYAVVEYFELYPDWLGDLKRIEDGVRYTYTTSYEGEDGGKGVISFVKTNEAGEELERTDIKVDGDNVEFPGDSEAVEPVPEEPIIVVPEEEPEKPSKVQPNPEGTIYTPEELEEIEKEFDYDDGIEYTLVD